MSHTQRHQSERSAQPRLGYLRSTVQRREERSARYFYEDEEEWAQLGGQEPQAGQLGSEGQERPAE